MKIEITSVSVSKKGRIYIQGELHEVPIGEMPNPEFEYELVKIEKEKENEPS